MNRKIFYAAFLIVLSAVCSFGQNPQAASSPVNLETILSETGNQVRNYREEFKNLLADETKTFERYDKNGQLKDKDTVDSTFLVYQSARNQNVSSELRNVLRVNGSPVSGSETRSEQFLGELKKQTTLESELKKLAQEGARYDKTLEVNGLTLFQATILSDNLRPYFDFQLQGTENYNGRQVYVVSYNQNKPSPYVSLKPNDVKEGEMSLNFDLNLPGALKKSDAFVRGKLWIDTENYQIWREEREVFVQQPNPVVLVTTVLEYQPSEYGILVPKQISLVTNSVKKNSNQYAAVKDMQVSFDYSKFRKPESDVKIIDEP